jgi:hypothetical protein
VGARRRRLSQSDGDYASPALLLFCETRSEINRDGYEVEGHTSHDAHTLLVVELLPCGNTCKPLSHYALAGTGAYSPSSSRTGLSSSR